MRTYYFFDGELRIILQIFHGEPKAAYPNFSMPESG